MIEALTPVLFIAGVVVTMFLFLYFIPVGLWISALAAGASVSDAVGAPLVFNKPDPRAYGVLVSTAGIHDAAILRLADRVKAALG